ncbi:uncharacterized protein LOC110632952 isoform X2 [Hevea brasiliensis]|uniref:uncharacterized protein LOC110632952 isoform X2 n=1 Tax=Hevea brasiliensis TaxID=3981 RepID=UPI0025D8C22D|nr:uncharacterized protein LOC110632952 isoform X2 [Hevea brasiliensis]
MSEGTSIVMESSENGTDISHDDTGNMEKIPDDTILSQQTAVNLVPFTKDLSLKMLPMNLIAVLQSNVAFPLDVTVLVEGMILAFMGFIKGKAPQTIMTDQNIWLKEAIALKCLKLVFGTSLQNSQIGFPYCLLGTCNYDRKAELL